MEVIPLSFNGGKDCCVLLHLLYIVLSKKGLFSRLKVLYFSHPNSFSEVNTFVSLCVQMYVSLLTSLLTSCILLLSIFVLYSICSYGLNLNTLPPLTLSTLQQQVDELAMQAIFMGTRSTDPRSSTLQVITPLSLYHIKKEYG